MTTLAEHIIVAGAENRPPMLEKPMYDSWASHIHLFIKRRNMTRPKKYSELTEAQQLQDDCDVQATNIIFHGLPTDVYALVNHQEAAKDIWDSVKLLMKAIELSYQERLINDMHTIRMTMQQVQVNTKFLNALPPEWSKFVTDVKLAKITSQQQSVSPQPFIPPPVTQQSQTEFPQMDSGLVVPTFQQGDDLIKCINKAIAFLSAMASRQTHSFVGSGNRGIATTLRGNYAASQPKVAKCYNCQGEGHMIRQCTQPKRPRNAAWFKEKLMLAEAQKAGQILDEDQLAFLADPGISEAPVAQQTIPQNSDFQTEDLDAYDSDCDNLSSAKAVLIVNLSSCDSDVLCEVPYSDYSLNDMINQDVQEMQYSEQTHIDDFQDNEIHSDSKIISYSQYLQESQDAVIQDTNSSAPNYLLVLSLVEQMTDHIANLNKEKSDK
ncbi:integrase, catalytic region, zinc finger, CCHC-type containing protein [Tanacetum coccineum]